MQLLMSSLRGIINVPRRVRARLGAKWCVVLLLIPPTVFGSIHFGPRAAMVVALSVLGCILASVIPRIIAKKDYTIAHPGTIITGLLLGLTLSAETPIYMIVVGALVAQLPGKYKPRWLGRNPFNPAALGRTAVAVLEFTDPLTSAAWKNADAISGASALFKDAGGHLRPALWTIFAGFNKGAIGETSEMMLLPVCILMLCFVVVKRQAAIAMIVTVPLLVISLPATSDIVGHAPWALNPLVYLLSSNTFLLATFFATDPMTTPRSRFGCVIFGVSVAVLGVLGRLYTTIPGMEMYAVLVGNMAVPVLDGTLWRKLFRRERPQFSMADGSTVEVPVPIDDSLAPGARFAVESFFATNGGEEPEIPDKGELVRLPSALCDEPFAVFRKVVADATPENVLQIIRESGLRGCGGARFPVHRKWEAVLAEEKPRILVVNGQEGEPETFKDRFIMQNHARVAVEGMAILATVIEPEEIIFVVTSRCANAVRQIKAAVDELRATREGAALPPIRVVPGADLYVCGEETALIQSLEPRRAEPQLRPPFPFQSGLRGLPTLVQNVETVSWLPSIVQHGPEWFRGTGGGVQLVSLSGAVRSPGVYEVETGTTLDEILKMGGGLAEGEELRAIAVGGPSSGLLPPTNLGLPFEHSALQDAGAALGTGAVRVFAKSECIVEEALKAARFFRDESCGRCTPCRVGTSEIVRLWERAAETQNAGDELGMINEVADVMRQASICGLGVAASNRVLLVVRHWPEVIQPHTADAEVERSQQCQV